MTCCITLFVVIICVSVSPFYVSRSMGYLYMVLSVRLVCLILTWVQFSSYFSQFIYAILGSVVKFCQFCLIGIQNVLLTHTAWFLTVLFLKGHCLNAMEVIHCTWCQLLQNKCSGCGGVWRLVKPTGSKWHGDSSMVFLAPLGVVGGVNHIFQQEFF